MDLPEAAQKRFWEVLAVYLRPSIDDEGQAVIVKFCSDHELAFEQVAPAIRATRLLFEEAARSAIALDAFASDLSTLLPDDGSAAAALLLPWLEDWLPRLRDQLVRRTIADHGKLVTDTRWRVQRITSSDRGLGIGTSIGVLTFTYAEGAREERISLHMTPEQLNSVRSAVDAMLA